MQGASSFLRVYALNLFIHSSNSIDTVQNFFVTAMSLPFPVGEGFTTTSQFVLPVRFLEETRGQRLVDMSPRLLWVRIFGPHTKPLAEFGFPVLWSINDRCRTGHRRAKQVFVYCFVSFSSRESHVSFFAADPSPSGATYRDWQWLKNARPR